MMVVIILIPGDPVSLLFAWIGDKLFNEYEEKGIYVSEKEEKMIRNEIFHLRWP